jgi:hypothetical protein
VASPSSKIIGSFTIIIALAKGYLLLLLSPWKLHYFAPLRFVLNLSGRVVMNLWAFATLVVASIFSV